ncbi:MAG: hypothetical protein AAGA80_06335 [Cyanobacteria bacterium P01_F01_bin.143]
MRNHWLTKAAIVTAINLSFTATALAYPHGTWRTRSTKLATKEQCINRGFRAMENAGLGNINTRNQDRRGVYGRNEQTISFILCQNGGALTSIFCSSYNSDESYDICDEIADYMEKSRS